MNSTLEETIEEIAFRTLFETSPKLLQMTKDLLMQGYTPEQIIDFYTVRTGYPRHQLAFVGCAADYLLRRVTVVSETEQ